MTTRTANFIDGAYLQRVVADEFSRARIDLSALAQTMANGADILRTYYYHCMPYQSSRPSREESERYAASQRFFTALELLPRFEVRLGRLEFRGNSPDGMPILEQKRVDIMLGVDMVQLAAKGHITHVSLLAGDSDFVPAVAVAKAEGVLVRLYHGSSCHVDLLREVDERVQIDRALIDSVLR